jgi:hypothetical protein
MKPDTLPGIQSLRRDNLAVDADILTAAFENDPKIDYLKFHVK